MDANDCRIKSIKTNSYLITKAFEIIEEKAIQGESYCNMEGLNDVIIYVLRDKKFTVNVEYVEGVKKCKVSWF